MPGPIEQLPQVCGRAPRRGKAVKVQNVIHRGRQGSQPGLQVLHPLLALGRKPGAGQQSRKQLEAAQRIADFVRENRRDFRQRLLAAQLVAFEDETLGLAYVLENEDRDRVCLRRCSLGICIRDRRMPHRQPALLAALITKALLLLRGLISCALQKIAQLRRHGR